MKKLLCTAIIFVLIGMTIFAQEAKAEEQPAQQGQQAQETGAKVPVGMGPLGRGTLSIDGMFLVGARARSMNQEGWDKDGNWALEGINPTWEENRADLYINYSLANYGAFIGLRAQNYGPNAMDYGQIFPRYAFIYGNFGPTRLSVGKLYDELLPVPGSRIWKSTGPGDSHRFTDDEAYSIRFEVKPIEGLNVGVQWFFPAFDGYLEGFRADGRNDLSGYYTKGLDESNAWREIGIGAQYSNSVFDIQAGVRFDSEVDRFNKFDTGPQGKGSYLDKYYGQASIMAKGVPAITFMASDIGDGARLPRYKHLDKIVKFDYSQAPNVTAEYLPYGDGHYAFFGFNYKGRKNMTANAHGGVYNLGAFNEFGYGRFSESVKFDKLWKDLGAGITLQQEFYGADVFKDEVINSPFFVFGPQISYDFITMPQMPTPLLKGTLETGFGVCADVLDIYLKIKPVLNISLGAYFIDLFYEMEYTGYTEATNIKPTTRHTAGLAFMLLF
ncbi:MAG: hypothetical protein LBF77_09125 [Spirochaetaceae bacterium]|jgi:hypothetical protein|nr:hypothetical protein [Spirochaetaceae bacterium]